MIGKAFVHGCHRLAPVFTTSATASNERPELRAYKLGKQKCSYNQVEMMFKDEEGEELRVSEAIEVDVGDEIEACLRECCLKFVMTFVNNIRIFLCVYLVFAEPHVKLKSGDEPRWRYHWMPVTRSRCVKGCTGSILRGLQRFGKMAKRTGPRSSREFWKEPKNLYIAIDEASTHITTSNGVIPKFRLLFAAYSNKHDFLGTAVSSSIRVYSNNDAPLGAAVLKVEIDLQGKAREGFLKKDDETGKLVNKGPFTENARLLQQIQNSPSKSVSKAGNKVLGIEAKPTSTQDKENCPEHHSLTQLCASIFEICAKKVGSYVSLRSLATSLAARKRRIYEIFCVLECINVVQSFEGTEKFLWLGSKRVPSALRIIKDKVLSMKPSQTRRIGQWSKDVAEGSVRDLTRRFLALFLLNEKRSMSLQAAIDKILDRHIDPQTYRSQARRITEIARIYGELKLISMDTAAAYQELSLESVYSWNGFRGVQERLPSSGSEGRPKRKNVIAKRENLRKRKRRRISLVISDSEESEEEEEEEEEEREEKEEDDDEEEEQSPVKCTVSRNAKQRKTGYKDQSPVQGALIQVSTSTEPQDYHHSPVALTPIARCREAHQDITSPGILHSLTTTPFTECRGNQDHSPLQTTQNMNHPPLQLTPNKDRSPQQVTVNKYHSSAKRIVSPITRCSASPIMRCSSSPIMKSSPSPIIRSRLCAVVVKSIKESCQMEQKAEHEAKEEITTKDKRRRRSSEDLAALLLSLREACPTTSPKPSQNAEVPENDDESPSSGVEAPQCPKASFEELYGTDKQDSITQQDFLHQLLLYPLAVAELHRNNPELVSEYARKAKEMYECFDWKSSAGKSELIRPVPVKWRDDHAEKCYAEHECSLPYTFL